MDFPASIARALAIPANDETGSIHDVKHVVVMMQDRSFDIFREDVLADLLPQVSWIVAPEAYTEHGNWPSKFGAWYVSQMIDALTANPEVCSKTVFFYMFDENDDFFDHIGQSVVIVVQFVGVQRQERDARQLPVKLWNQERVNVTKSLAFRIVKRNLGQHSIARNENLIRTEWLRHPT
jgi:hypothetical protein